jgi:hypothetical protein
MGMRRSYGIRIASALVLAGAVSQAGCFFAADFDDCSRYPRASCFDGGGGGPSEGCDPSKATGPVPDTCGVFVSSAGDDGALGTKAKPLKTLGAALKKARTIYMCGEPFTEAVRIEKAATIYGAVDCTHEWAYDASRRTHLSAPPDAIPLVIDTKADVEVSDMEIDAAGAATGGGSSIAVLVSWAATTLRRCGLTAGDAKDGEAGSTTPDDTLLDGDPGDPGASTCDIGLHPGPLGKVQACATGGSSTAGSGGDGGQIVSSMLQPASSGANGSPADTSQPTKGQGGLGEGQGTPAATSCDDGTSGASGSAGTSGEGATGPGDLTQDGYLGALGKDGTNGKPGQGGGGGGGAKGALSVTCGSTTTALPGASGGAGGTGGCGGTFGGGGKPGGSSIALLVLGAEVTLVDVTLSAGKGGQGGPGGNGQSGGQKGGGGAPGAGKGAAQAGCRGGDGGQGGPGGPGGGGQGGHSLGIALKGAKVPYGGTFQIDATANGKGGPGGVNNAAAGMGQGTEGIAASCWDFGSNKACGT